MKTNKRREYLMSFFLVTTGHELHEQAADIAIHYLDEYKKYDDEEDISKKKEIEDNITNYAVENLHKLFITSNN